MCRGAPSHRYTPPGQTVISDQDWQLLTRYLGGELTPDEAEAFKRSLAASPERARWAETMIRAWRASGAPATESEARASGDDRWQVVAARAGLPVPRDGSAHRVRRLAWRNRAEAGKGRPTAWRWVGLAAAAAVAVMVDGPWREAGEPSSGAPTDVAAQVTYTAPRGKRAHITLADGSRVTLAPGSVLQLDSDFTDGARTVRLDGEALFDVRHDEARPFTVHTATGLARDLGTRFTVRAFPGDSTTVVVVAEGLVSLRAALDAVDSVTLRPGELGRVNATGALGRQPVVVSDYLAFAEGRLLLRDVPLREAIETIARWYDIELQLADPRLGALRLTGEFTSEPLSDVLQFLTAPVGLTYERDGRHVTLLQR